MEQPPPGNFTHTLQSYSVCHKWRTMENCLRLQYTEQRLETAERCWSGRTGLPAKQFHPKRVTGVRIPPSPPSLLFLRPLTKWAVNLRRSSRQSGRCIDRGLSFEVINRGSL